MSWSSGAHRSWGQVPAGAMSAGQRFASGAGKYIQTGFHRSGTNFALNTYGLGRGKMGTLGRAFGLGFLGFDAYQGYQEGGTMGAVTNVAKGAAIHYAIGAVLGTAAAPLALAAAGAGLAAGAYAYNKYGSEIGRSVMVNSAQLEMGGGISDPYGNASTMRRRSLMAMHNSRLNGRVSMGNEAALTYTPYYR